MLKKICIGTAIIAVACLLTVQVVYAGPGRDHGPGAGVFTAKAGNHSGYVQNYRVITHYRGHLPPGLAKTHKVTPGHTKKWKIGRPLERNVVFHDPPQIIVAQLGPPPAHHRYVQVAQDILLLAIGTGMVVDAIENLNWEFNR
ncbi:MAG: hypothetical protein AVO39_11445 [delta proteobacterium MLS_D]|nr:MAG: hypothetical protein AVO39_11445 [delta proteobacterium MLS_D]